MKNLKLKIIVLGMGVVFTSCKKTVVEQVCKKRYITSVKVLQVENSGSFDLLNGPDLRIYLAAGASSTWSYSSNVSDDVDSYPFTIAFPNRILVSNESWDFRMVDVDAIQDELVCKGNFNPHEDGISGIIKLTKDDEDVLEFIYQDEE